jgi:hypothetical protein
MMVRRRLANATQVLLCCKSNRKKFTRNEPNNSHIAYYKKIEPYYHWLIKVISYCFQSQPGEAVVIRVWSPEKRIQPPRGPNPNPFSSRVLRERSSLVRSLFAPPPLQRWWSTRGNPIIRPRASSLFPAPFPSSRTRICLQIAYVKPYGIHVW